MQMSKNQRDLLQPLRADPTEVWTSEFPLRFKLLKNGRRLLLPSSISAVVGVAGFEPATLRLSSACSNQLSYTPGD